MRCLHVISPNAFVSRTKMVAKQAIFGVTCAGRSTSLRHPIACYSARSTDRQTPPSIANTLLFSSDIRRSPTSASNILGGGSTRTVDVLPLTLSILHAIADNSFGIIAALLSRRTARRSRSSRGDMKFAAKPRVVVYIYRRVCRTFRSCEN